MNFELVRFVLISVGGTLAYFLVRLNLLLGSLDCLDDLISIEALQTSGSFAFMRVSKTLG